MKNVPFTFFCIMLCCSVFSQTGKITGKVTNRTNMQGLEFVSIVCKSNSQIIKTTITTQKGGFIIDNLPLTNVLIEASYLGYKSEVKTILLTSQQPYATVNFSLTPNIEQLDEVSITKKKTIITQKADKKIITVGDDLISLGTNALELLQNTPFVLVDTQNQTISMRGSENVRIFIDGKPSNLSTSQTLKQIQSNNVKQIELITNPSVKYTAEGTGGIINFILKKNKQYGFNGTISLGVERGQNTRPSLSTKMNYREGKVNFFGSYSLDLGKTNTVIDLYRTDKNLNQDIDFVYDDVYQNFKGGADIYFNDKNTVSFYTNQALSNADYLVYSKATENNTLLIDQNTISKLKTHEQTYNIDYKLTFNDKEHIEFDASFIKTKSPEDNIYRSTINPTSKEYNFFNDIKINTSNWLFHIDYAKSLTETSKLETGIDIRLLSTFNEILSDQVISSQQLGKNMLIYDRDIYAYYAKYSNQFNKFSVDGGLRFEYFKVNGVFNNIRNNTSNSSETYKSDIFNIYPSISLTYFASEKNEWYVSYTRRVDRPSIDQVTPIPDFSTPLTISIGNQNLNPQYTNTVELNFTHSFKAGYSSLSGVYKTTNDKIDRSISVDNQFPDLQTLSFVNNEKGIDQFGFELYTEIQLKKRLTTNFSANYYNQQRTGFVNNEIKTIKNNQFYTTLNNRFKVNDKFSLQLNALYVATSKSLIYLIKPYGKIDFGAQLKVLNNNGSINFRVNDIFKTMKIRFSSEAPLPQTGFTNTELRTFYIGFSYNFGNGKNKARARKYRDKNETQSNGGVL